MPQCAAASRWRQPSKDVKRRLKDRAPKTVNTVLTVLNMLKKAVEWDVTDDMPCTIRPLRCVDQ
ncbi:MAG TPA: hypothetical protein VNI78_12895 [Vicinamibacterales bacterium]|nr:hypothetical protein [Vicinamibacterales bacterium]